MLAPTIDTFGVFQIVGDFGFGGRFFKEGVGVEVGFNSLLTEFFGNRGFLGTGLRETSLRLLGGKAVVDSSLLSLKSSPRF